MQGNAAAYAKSFCPCQKYRHRFCGACIFCLCVKFLKRGTRVPGNTRDRCRWQMKGACVGAAVGKIKDKRKPTDFSGLPQEGIVCLLPLPKTKALKFRSTARFQGSFFCYIFLNFLTARGQRAFFLMLKTVFKLSNFSVKSNLSVPYSIKKASVYNIDE